MDIKEKPLDTEEAGHEAEDGNEETDSDQNEGQGPHEPEEGASAADEAEGEEEMDTGTGDRDEGPGEHPEESSEDEEQPSLEDKDEDAEACEESADSGVSVDQGLQPQVLCGVGLSYIRNNNEEEEEFSFPLDSPLGYFSITRGRCQAAFSVSFRPSVADPLPADSPLARSGVSACCRGSPPRVLSPRAFNAVFHFPAEGGKRGRRRGELRHRRTGARGYGEEGA